MITFTFNPKILVIKMKDLKDLKTLKKKQIDYRVIILKNLFKVFKICKSFTQQKIATKLKKTSSLLKSDPENEKLKKSFRKFENKIQMIKSLNSEMTKSAAFVYAKFDLKLNFDPIKEKVSELLESDMDELVKDIFSQFEKEGVEKKSYLLFYQHMKEKPQKRFTEIKEQSLKLINDIKNRKDAKRIRKQNQISKKRGKNTESDKNKDNSDFSEKSQNEENEENDSDLEDIEIAQEEPTEEQMGMREKLVEGLEKIIQKNTFFPRNREKDEKSEKPKNKTFSKKINKDFGSKEKVYQKKEEKQQNFKNIEKRKDIKKPQPDKTESYHPSYLSKINTRKEQKAKKYEGQIIDL